MHIEYQLDCLENSKGEEYEECLINQFYEMNMRFRMYAKWTKMRIFKVTSQIKVRFDFTFVTEVR